MAHQHGIKHGTGPLGDGKSQLSIYSPWTSAQNMSQRCSPHVSIYSLKFSMLVHMMWTIMLFWRRTMQPSC